MIKLNFYFKIKFIDILDRLYNMPVEELVKTFCDPGTSDYIVVYLR
jgi:hypothetical protein